MKPVYRLILTCSFALFGTAAWACPTCMSDEAPKDGEPNRIKIESACYAPKPTPDQSRSGTFVLQYYVDSLQDNVVGGFVRYNRSRSTTPLLFQEKVAIEDPGLENFEMRWLEVVGDKITGSYTLTQSGGGNRQGRYVEYKNFKSKHVFIYQEIGSAETCQERSDRMMVR